MPILVAMSVKKKILIGLPLLLVLLLAVAYASIDELAATAVEKGGARALGVATTLDRIELKPFRGQGSVKGLEVSNPPGFKTPWFMRLSEGDASLEVSTVLEDQVVMDFIELRGIEIYLEKTKDTANYEVLLETMKKEEQTAPPSESGKKFLVRRIVLEDITVHAVHPGFGRKSRTLDVKIDEILLENVGSGTDSGLVMSQLMGTIVKATLAAVIDQGVKLPVEITKDLGTGLAGLGKSGVTVTVKVAGKVIEGAEKVIGGAVKGVAGTIDDIFGGSDDK
ncbi:MAG: hypothetical protein ACKVWV_16925 [Planctomycetota bacterium]